MTSASKEFLYSLGDMLFHGIGLDLVGGAGGGQNNAQLKVTAIGGGFLFMSCTTIDYQSTAVTNMNGQVGPVGEAASGGYGGAAGGIAWFAAHTYTHSPASSGTVKVDGGAGSAGGVARGAGGAGGAGDKEVFTY
jgi:hypothetical protein